MSNIWVIVHNLIIFLYCKELVNKEKKFPKLFWLNSEIKLIFKIIYPTSQDVENLISLASSLPESELESKLPELLGNHINSYTLTKHLGEHEVQKHQEGFPCTIVRPSMSKFFIELPGKATERLWFCYACSNCCLEGTYTWMDY